jgi:DNA-binding XRE family transcriptional regulator
MPFKAGMSSTKKVDISFVRNFRKHFGYSQDDFAKIIQTDRSNYAKKEKGKVPITLQEWILIIQHVRKEHNFKVSINGEPLLLPDSSAQTVNFTYEAIDSFPILKKIITESNEAALTKDRKLLIRILEYAIDVLSDAETSSGKKVQRASDR